MATAPLPDALPGTSRRGTPGPDALEPGFHCASTHWIRGFMGFQLVRRTRIVMLVVPA